MALDERHVDTFGPVLSDGTALRDLVDLEARTVSLRLFADPEIYRLEMERIFARDWVILAHDSELPEPGDYVRRTIGEDVVVVTRADDGAVSVFLNVCTHRGMQVCRGELGTSQTFKCPYHGWTFGNDGAFLGAPFEHEMYGDDLDHAVLGLRRARVGRRWGLIFATWDAAAPEFEDWLGDVAWYLDTILGRTDHGIEVVGTPQRYSIPANWKWSSNQASGDGYHALALHKSVNDVLLPEGAMSTDMARGLQGINVCTPHGHGLRCVDQLLLRGADGANPEPLELLRGYPTSGLPAELVPELERHLDADQLRLLATSPPVVAGLFPNVAFLAFPSPSPSGQGWSFGFHSYVPAGPGRIEMTHWHLVERDASPTQQHETNMTSVLSTGISGIIEQDDAWAWAELQKSVQGVMGARETMRFPAIMGELRPEGWAGGGRVSAGTSKDDNQWNWWLRYLELMTAAPG
jgi:nitrite reductase/ring-hydroxylating ferredoxin subunit